MMKHPLLAIASLVFASVFPACSLLGGEDASPDGRVLVTVDDGVIAIRNGTTERIYYAVIARDVLPLIFWGQHVTVEEGPSLAPDQRADLSAADVWGFSEAGTEVVVYWWRVEVREGERMPTEPESVVVTL